MSEKSHKLLRGRRGFWGERVKYFDFSEVVAALKAGENVHSAEFCPKCETELSRTALMYDEVDINYCPVCGKSFAKEDGINLYTIDEYPVCVVCEDCAYGELA